MVERAVRGWQSGGGSEVEKMEMVWKGGMERALQRCWSGLGFTYISLRRGLNFFQNISLGTPRFPWKFPGKCWIFSFSAAEKEKFPRESLSPSPLCRCLPSVQSISVLPRQKLAPVRESECVQICWWLSVVMKPTSNGHERSETVMKRLEIRFSSGRGLRGHQTQGPEGPYFQGNFRQ